MKKWTFGISILLNVLFILALVWNWLNSPTNELGRLEKDIEIGYFQSDNSVFRIPKGLTVRNVSERGLSSIGQFENERFSIVITSDDASLVNYNLPKDSLDMFGNFYSAEIPQNKNDKDYKQIVKNFAEQYSPRKSESLNSIPINIINTFTELREIDEEAHAKYVTLIFTKLYVEHLTCCNQTYKIVEFRNFDLSQPSMIKEFDYISGYLDKDNLPEFWTSGIIESWLKENPKYPKMEEFREQIRKLSTPPSDINN